jgi:tripartite-type tricarboxylate transporter receptor subunit TctC
MKSFRPIVAAILAAASCAAFSAYPERPVKLIVPWAAGGDTDVIYRALQPHLQKHLGNTVVISNVGGAGGTKGAKEAKEAAPDGYTIFAVHDSIHSSYYTGVGDVNWTDFQPICLVSSTPSIVTGSPKVTWADMKALVADAKARPGQVTVGATLGSTSHFFPAMVEKAAGVKFKYVSYDGTAPRMNALLGGHIDMGESNLTQKGKADAGQLKFLAIATDKRSPEIPNVPTLKELGIDVTYAVNRGLLAPKGTPADVMAKLESACKAAASEPAFAAAMKEQGTFVSYKSPKDYTEFLKANDVLNRDLAKDLGMLKR